MKQTLFAAIVMLYAFFWTAPVAADQHTTELLVGQTFVNAVPVGFWVGQERGLFKKYGVDVKIVQFRGNPVGTQALLTGAIPVLMAGPHSAVAARAAGADLVEFATVAPTMPYLVVTRKEIKSAEQLKGKIFGVSGTGLSASYIGVILGLKHLGLDPKRDRITIISSGNEVERQIALGQNGIQATVFDMLYKPMIEKDGFPVLADLGALNIPWEHDVLLSTGKYLKENPRSIEGVLKGLLEANAFILNPSNREAVKKTLVRNLGPKMGDGTAAYEQVTSLWVRAKPYPNRKGIQAIIDEVKNINPAVGKLNVNDFVDESILKKLDQSGFIEGLYPKGVL